MHSTNYPVPVINKKLQKEIESIIEEVTPLEPIDTEYNQVIFIKQFNAIKIPFVKPTDKAITKVVKNTLVGTGTVIAMPFLILKDSGLLDKDSGSIFAIPAIIWDGGKKNHNSIDKKQNSNQL